MNFINHWTQPHFVLFGWEFIDWNGVKELEITILNFGFKFTWGKEECYEETPYEPRVLYDLTKDEKTGETIKAPRMIPFNKENKNDR